MCDVVGVFGASLSQAKAPSGYALFYANDPAQQEA
jgi:hypothetical protein